MSRFVDLSVVINENTPNYPGDPRTEVEPEAVFEDKNYRDSRLTIGTHTGTHIDAPFHMIEDGVTLEGIPLEQFSGRGVLIKVEGEYNIEDVKSADITEGDVVLFNTGKSEVYYQDEYFEDYPSLTSEIAEYLVVKRVKLVGVDTCSVDKEPFGIHKTLLKNKVLIMENLTNLDALVNKEFKVYAFPIRLQGDGAPVRVVAEVEEDE